jgi:hypothetical protein
MTTQLVNLHVKDLRKYTDKNGRKYDNLREWLSFKENVYIGRRGRIFINKEIFTYKGSIWENPFTVGKDGTIDEVRDKYYQYITNKIHTENLYNELLELKGNVLGCWCCPNKCHGDVILYLLSQIN